MDRIKSALELKEDNNMFVIDRFDDIKWYFEKLSLPTVQKYSMVLRKLVPMLHLKQETEDEYVRSFLSISARCKTPNPRPKPNRAPTNLINRPEEIPLPAVVPLAVNASRLNRKADNNVLPSVLEQMDTLTPTFLDKRGNPLDGGTRKLYKTNMLAVMKRFDPPQRDLNFLVTNTQDVINMFNTLGIHTAKAYYNACIRYLPIARPISAQQKAYDMFYAWLKPLPTPAAVYHPEVYLGYTWETLLQRIQDIIKTDKKLDPLYRLLFSLYTDQITRRSKDYTFMLINKPDNKINNILVFNDFKQKFVFNDFKTSKKTKPQTVLIEEATKQVLQDYLKKHVSKNQEYLLMRKGKPLDKQDISTILREEIGKKYDIPMGIRRLRHLYATYITVDKPIDLRLLQEIAYKMGTSDTVIIRNYADFKRAVDTGTD